MDEKVLILDFGSQYTRLIARRIRELGVYSEIFPFSIGIETVVDSGVKGIVLSGGPAGVGQETAPAISGEWLELGVPVLGICYGMQLIADLCGGSVLHSDNREYGRAAIRILKDDPLFSGFNRSRELTVWMSHGDHVDSVPSGFSVSARSADGVAAACSDPKRGIYCTQFHPEVSHTEKGGDILANFVFGICGCRGSWNEENFIDKAILKVKNAVPPGKNVICGVSGGVDSTVAAVLVQRAVGGRLKCIMVDNGLLREGERKAVGAFLGEKGLGLNLTIVDASERFLSALAGVTAPEKKRKIIGGIFVDVFEEEAGKIRDVSHLVQGTLYPDVIESVSTKGPSQTIKTHHNVGGLPDHMGLELIEPLRELFKDEVRRIGAKLGVPAELLARHPFPGPGLAVRVVGEVTDDRLARIRKGDGILLSEIESAGLYNSLWQVFTVLLPVKSVGVMGDSRTYEEALVIRAVKSQDAMTAEWAFLPEELLRRVSSRIINEVKGINRVMVDISSKPPATIEWE